MTYWTMVIGTLALTGFPLTAGYFSKDAIIEAAFVGKNPMAGYAFGMTVIAAGLTAFYSWRLIFKTFHGTPHDRHHYEGAHESPLVVLVPLIALAAGAILSGYPFKELFAGHLVEGFFRELIKQSAAVIEAIHHVPWQAAWSPTVMMVDRYADCLAVLYPSARYPGGARTSARACSTASCSTSGTSTRSTIS